MLGHSFYGSIEFYRYQLIEIRVYIDNNAASLMLFSAPQKSSSIPSRSDLSAESLTPTTPNPPGPGPTSQREKILHRYRTAQGDISRMLFLGISNRNGGGGAGGARVCDKALTIVACVESLSTCVPHPRTLVLEERGSLCAPKCRSERERRGTVP